MALSDAVREAFAKGNGGGGRSAALPDNTRVNVTIQPSTKAIGYIERRPFSSKEASPNNRLEALNVRFVVPEGEQHANKNFFANIPVLFEMWSERAGKLVPSYLSIGLVKSLGYSLEDVEDDTLKKITDRELLNKRLQLVLGVEPDPKFVPADAEEAAKAAANPLYAMRNTVKFINPPSSAPAAPVNGGYAAASGGFTGGAPRAAAPAAAAPAVANDPWLAQAAAAPAADPWAAAAAGATV